jgi:glycosyltransferase involved in cell wall biosynthesis
MRLLFVSQWCYPEPDARILLMASELVKKGHSIQILTGFPNYPGGKIYQGYRLKLFQRENIHNVDILRVWLYPSHDKSAIKRILNYVSFSISACILGLIKANKPDLIYVYHPPATVAIPAIILGKIFGAKVVYDIQDLWPDSLESTGMIKNIFLLKMVNKFQNFVYRNAHAITVISNGFKTRIIERGVSSHKVNVIRNWSIPIGDGKNSSYQNLFIPNKFILMFAGNLGKAQGLKSVIDAAKILLESKITDIQFVFIGSGSSKEELVNYSNQSELTNVTFLERVTPDKVSGVLLLADVLLIHLIKDPLFSITIPSKTQSYMMIGKPILAGVEGDAADLINEAEAGLVFEPENPKALIEQLLKLKSMQSEKLKQLGINGKEYYYNNLALNAGVEKFENLFALILKENK